MLYIAIAITCIIVTALVVTCLKNSIKLLKQELAFQHQRNAKLSEEHESAIVEIAQLKTFVYTMPTQLSRCLTLAQTIIRSQPSLTKKELAASQAELAKLKMRLAQFRQEGRTECSE